MANVEIFKIASDTIDKIKEFDGSDQNQLPNFINRVDNVQAMINNCGPGFDIICKDAVRSKCTGDANQTIQNATNSNEWHIIKQLLIDHFGEKKAVATLVEDIKTLPLRGTIENYYSKMKQLMQRANNARELKNDTEFSVESIQRCALRNFISQMPRLARTVLSCKDPQTVERAYEVIIQEEMTQFTQNGAPDEQNKNSTNASTSKQNNFNRNNNSYNNRNNNNNGRNNNYQGNNYNPNYNRNNNYQGNNYNPNYNRNNNNSNNNQNNNNNNNQNQNNGYNRNQNYNNNRNQNNASNTTTYTRQTNNSNNNRNNNNNYNNNNNSGNYRRNNYQNNNNNNNRANTTQTRQQVQNVEPMEIGQVASDFRTVRESNSLT